MLVYLPVGIDVEDDVWTMSDAGTSKSSVPREVKLELLHKALEMILEPVCSVTHAGFNCSDGDGRELRCHAVLAEVAGNGPKVKDLTCLLHGCKTRKPCCRCNCDKPDLNNGKKYSARSIFEIRDVLQPIASTVALTKSHSRRDWFPG